MRCAPDVMDGTYAPPVSDGSGTDRAASGKAFEILKAAGYETRGRRARQHGERSAARLRGAGARGRGREPGARHAAHLRAARREDFGPARRVRCSIEVRIKDFDYDMIRFVYPSSLSPGNEQNNRWSSAEAHNPGSSILPARKIRRSTP